MNDNYTKWLEGEKSWIDEVEKKMKREAWMYSPLVVAGCAVILGAIGLLAGGGISGMLHNVVYGVIFGVICIPLIHLAMLTSYPAKRYMKCLKAEIEDVLSPAERETFARQMLGMEGEVKVIPWTAGGKLEGIREGKVRLTTDYAVLTISVGVALMVQLSKVKYIDVDVREYTVTTRSSGFRMQQTSTVYPMYFYYQPHVEGQKQKCDKEFSFEIRQTREELSHYLHERQIGGYGV